MSSDFRAVAVTVAELWLFTPSTISVATGAGAAAAAVTADGRLGRGDF